MCIPSHVTRRQRTGAHHRFYRQTSLRDRSRKICCYEDGSFVGEKEAAATRWRFEAEAVEYGRDMLATATVVCSFCLCCIGRPSRSRTRPQRVPNPILSKGWDGMAGFARQAPRSPTSGGCRRCTFVRLSSTTVGFEFTQPSYFLRGIHLWGTMGYIPQVVIYCLRQL